MKLAISSTSSSNGSGAVDKPPLPPHDPIDSRVHAAVMHYGSKPPYLVEAAACHPEYRTPQQEHQNFATPDAAHGMYFGSGCEVSGAMLSSTKLRPCVCPTKPLRSLAGSKA